MLAELGPLLYGINYVVFLRAYRCPFVPDAPAEWYVYQALGPDVVVGGIGEVGGPEVLAEVESALRYAGDRHAGPKPVVLRSRRYKGLVRAVLSELEQAVAEASVVATFWLREGHPAYPVFWDFAFVIAGPAGGLVFVGSSSD